MASKDTAENMAADRKQVLRREKLRKCSCQTLTFFLAIIKLYCITLIQGGMTIFNANFGEKNYILKLSFLFGLTIFGNLVDNVSQPRWLFLYA